ncbi:Mn2+ and Fe2+ transporters of the NRAMP family [Modestobacter sp. DSM 44400]|uniref:NRAMP family divalent metal transporter n=1 Tax=Modestobacter sp. DSM 44400 TaxID=1550230 RepID=UPI0008959927|nr:NRAMP family divalent metal transporter [Modestobacter sp. DSM 44400]SDX83361.1 Mn2+ and Fe2+ transporters of the NRAMP family [Modestobacter sp. DSM 44400]
MAHEPDGPQQTGVPPAGPQPDGKLTTSTRSTLLGAMFLMATSAIGPGFITQTTTFTVQLGAAFAFAIVISILLDIALQLNVWRVIGVSGRRAQELGNLVAPGLGWVMAAFLLIGGLVFNIGNVSGAGLGTDAMFGLDPKIGGAISALIAIGIFLSKKAGVAVDRIVVVLGLVMIALTTYIAVTSGPPVGQALRNVVLPEQVDTLAITTLVGGTIGGYIVYAGAHRLLDSGVTGPEHVRDITRGSITGILITAVMRVVLFLAILGVVAGGAALDPNSQAASAFGAAAGEVGLRVFGIVLWAASITSVIGASYTSVSFVTSRTRTSDRTRTLLVCGFIAVTTLAFVLIGAAPTTLLVFAGAFNGLLLPIGIAVLLWVATRRTDLLGGYRYPRWLLAIGWVAWLLTLYLAVNSVRPVIELFS